MFIIEQCKSSLKLIKLNVRSKVISTLFNKKRGKIKKKNTFVDMTQLGLRASRKTSRQSSMHKFLPLSFLILNAMDEGMNPFSGT